jgi:hypothetical protein
MRTSLPAAAIAVAIGAACVLLPGVARSGTTLAVCSPASLQYRVTRVEGAAGTFLIHLEVRTRRLACVVVGYPSLEIVGRGGRLPTLVHHGGLAILDRRVRRVAVRPKRPARLLVSYNSVPAGSETSCPRGTALVVGGVRVAVATRACSHGRLLESPYIR